MLDAKALSSWRVDVGVQEKLSGQARRPSTSQCLWLDAQRCRRLQRACYRICTAATSATGLVVRTFLHAATSRLGSEVRDARNWRERRRAEMSS
jgi:hypothetical protein